jgi:hypothetical protein
MLIGIQRLWVDLFWVDTVSDFVLCAQHIDPAPATANGTRPPNSRFICNATLSEFLSAVFQVVFSTQEDSQMSFYEVAFNLRNLSELTSQFDWKFNVTGSTKYVTTDSQDLLLERSPRTLRTDAAINALSHRVLVAFGSDASLILQRKSALGATTFRSVSWPSQQRVLQDLHTGILFGFGTINATVPYNVTQDLDILFTTDELRGQRTNWTIETSQSCFQPAPDVSMDSSGLNNATNGPNWGSVYLADTPQKPFDYQTLNETVRSYSILCTCIVYIYFN